MGGERDRTAALADRSATDTVTDTFFVSDQGAINANQIVALADGDLWLPLFDPSDVVRVAVPA